MGYTSKHEVIEGSWNEDHQVQWVKAEMTVKRKAVLLTN
jgi:hypothetical protein